MYRERFGASEQFCSLLRYILNLPQILPRAGDQAMGTQDVSNIRGIVINLVSLDRTIDQQCTEVLDFKVAALKLIARLAEITPRGGEDTAPKQ